MIYQGMLALLAMKTQRPVRLVFTREESIISTAKRHPSRTRLRMGLMRDGRIRAYEMTMVCDGGAYVHVDRKRHAQGGGPRAPVPMSSPTSRSTPTVSTLTTLRPARFARSARYRPHSPPNPISTSARKGSVLIRSRSAASTPCTTVRLPTPGSSSVR